LVRFLVRLIATGIVAVPLLVWFADAGLPAALFAAASVAVLGWLIVDRLILPLAGRTVALLSDAALAYAFLWFAGDVMNWPLGLWELSAAALPLAFVTRLCHALGQAESFST